MSALELPLHVEAHGMEPGDDVDTFLLIHGYGGSAFTWRYWVGPLARRGHVIVIDLKGFGAAPKPDDELYAPSDQVDLLHRLLTQRRARRLTLVGHSMGGGLALFLALRVMRDDPALLRRMVLVATAAYRQPLPPFVALAHKPRFSQLAMRVLGPRRVIRAALEQIVHDDACVTDHVVEGYAEPLGSDAAVRALIASAVRIVPPDLDILVERYPTLDVPTLLLWGRHDRVIPLWVGERLAQDLPRGRLRVLEGCGHVPMEELPEASLAALTSFLDES